MFVLFGQFLFKIKLPHHATFFTVYALFALQRATFLQYKRSCTTNQLQVSNFKINQTIFQRHSCVMAHEKRIQDKHNRIFGVNNIKESVFVSFIQLSGKLFTWKKIYIVKVYNIYSLQRYNTNDCRMCTSNICTSAKCEKIKLQILLGNYFYHCKEDIATQWYNSSLNVLALLKWT